MTGSLPAWLALAAICFMAACYALFLWASWQQYLKESTSRESKVNELLDRLSKPGKATVIPSDDPTG
jgi:TRAP-type C4-dicarboxylate transport system permease small subunit